MPQNEVADALLGRRDEFLRDRLIDERPELCAPLSVCSSRHDQYSAEPEAMLELRRCPAAPNNDEWEDVDDDAVRTEKQPDLARTRTRLRDWVPGGRTKTVVLH